jgi:WD40 repeat protein
VKSDKLKIINSFERYDAKMDLIAISEHGLLGKKVLIPRVSLRSHFDSIRELKFCANDQLMASVSEDCMLKLWDAKAFKNVSHYNDSMIEPLHTYRGHTGPLFALTTNRGNQQDDTLIYSAGSEGVIRVWKVPKLIKERFPSRINVWECFLLTRM